MKNHLSVDDKYAKSKRLAGKGFQRIVSVMIVSFWE